MSLTEADIKKMSARDRVLAFGILYDKERLERGQSTENIAYADLTKGLEEIQREKRKLAKDLGLDVSQDATGSAVPGEVRE